MSLWDLGKKLVPRQLYGTLWFLSRSYRTNRATRKYVRQLTGQKVADGPFRGMSYVDDSTGSVYCPKLLGTYEKELWPIVTEIVATPYSTVIDIGAAEGYYAVGLAYRMPAAKVIAFEADETRHYLLRALTERNSVTSRIEIHGLCDPESLKHTLAAAQQPLIVCDVEGAEMELLDPDAIPSLAQADLLVELHDFLRPGVGKIVEDRFASTHQITRISARPRTTADLPAGIDLPKKCRIAAIDEFRPAPMQWLWMKRRIPS